MNLSRESVTESRHGEGFSEWTPGQRWSYRGRARRSHRWCDGGWAESGPAKNLERLRRRTGQRQVRTLTQITPANVSQLQLAWSYPTYDNVSYRFGPIVANDVAYVLARNNSLVALDATTGKEIWIHAELQGMAPRGINYWESPDGRDRRLIYQRNGFLEAIDARTGQSILTFGANGAVNLREGLGRDPKTIGQVQSPNPGKIFENLIILGSAPGEAYLSPPGDLRAFNVVTGALAWQFHNPPHPGEFGYETWPKDAWKYVGGTNTWGEISVDPVRGIAYFPIGSPTYDYYGADRHGANLFGTSLVALDARTGKRLWHFQMVHHDLWDYDNTAAPQLTTIRHNGQLVDVVAQAGKTGFLYVFNRVTGEPIWPIEERPVPKSDVPGEESWPTQPFPTNPPPFAKQSLNENEINQYILTPEERETWKTRIAAARKGQSVHPSRGWRGDGRHSRRAGRRQLGHDRGQSDRRHGVRVEHQRAVDLQAEYAGAGRKPRRGAGPGRRRQPGSDRTGRPDLRPDLPELPRPEPGGGGQLPLTRQHHHPAVSGGDSAGRGEWPPGDAAPSDADGRHGCAPCVPRQSRAGRLAGWGRRTRTGRRPDCRCTAGSGGGQGRAAW